MRINKKITNSIAGASVVLTVLGIVSKGIGFLREIIYAQNFGLSFEFDLFLSSIALPSVINTAVIYISQHYFVPNYNKIKKESKEAAIDFFNYTFWWFIIYSIILTLLLYLASGELLHLYLASVSAEKQLLGLRIFSLFLITIPINTGISVIMAYQQAEFEFVNPALSLITLNIMLIILIVLFSELLEILILPVSFIAAYLTAFIFIVITVRKDLKLFSKKIFKEKYKLSELNSLIFLIFIEGLSLSYVLIDRYFIGDVSEGGIAALNYAFVIFSLPTSLFIIPLITTMFSKFSNSPQTLPTDFKNSLAMNYFIIIPFMIILFFWGDYFLHLFYERGKFSSYDTLITFSVLKHYLIGLIFLSIYYLMVKILYSLNRFAYVLAISVVAFILKILFNIYLVKVIEQDGLALSTSLIYIFLCLSSIIFVLKVADIKNKSSVITRFIYFIVNGSIAYITSNLIVGFANPTVVDFNIVRITLFIFIYIINSYILDDSEFRIIKDTVINIIR